MNKIKAKTDTGFLITLKSEFLACNFANNHVNNMVSVFFLGVLFCVGGRGASGDPFKSIECYDPRNNKWFGVTEMMSRRRHVGVCWSGGIA